MFKSINEPDFPTYMKNKFQTVNERHKLNLRFAQNAKLIIPKPKTEFFRKSFAYSRPKIWNDIPVHIGPILFGNFNRLIFHLKLTVFIAVI
jgi:hypothetical protein